MSFKGKVVLVTGGSSGIGASTAILFAKEGASVTIVGRNEDKLHKVQKQCQDFGGTTLVIKADITKDEEVKTVIDKTIGSFGKLDVLVNNAGIIKYGSILQGNLLEKYDEIMRINLRSVVHIVSLAAPYLVKTKGNIVNVSSVASVSFLGDPYFLAYAISKAGLDHFTRGAALELYALGVRVNTVSPGPTRTEVLKNAGSDQSWEETRDKLKLDRISEPEEIADLIAFLASDKAKSITGGYYAIDNGTLLKN